MFRVIGGTRSFIVNNSLEKCNIVMISVLNSSAISKTGMRMNTLSKSLLILANLVLVAILAILVGISMKKILDNSGNCSESYPNLSQYLIKIQLNETLANAYPKYSLYYYSPPGRAWFKGIPAVFIHGHGGSFSHGFRLVHETTMAGLSHKYHYDFFLMDFSEEMSALLYKFIDDQTKFTYDCIKHVLILCPQQRSVVVFGHSMGGLVAMGMPSLPYFDDESVAALILLASPQQMPIVNLDSRLDVHYDNIRKRWRDGEVKEKVAVASIGGGENDLIVRMGLTSLSRIDSNKLLWTSTTSFPTLWRSVSHIKFILCIELNEAIARALYDIVDDSKGQITDNRTLIRSVFRQRFTPDHLPPVDESSPINKSLSWNEVDFPWNLQDHQVTPGYIVIKLLGRNTGIIIMSDSNMTNWIGGCNSTNGTICDEMKDLSTRGFILPSASQVPTKFINLVPDDLASFDDLVTSNLHALNLRIEAATNENYKSLLVSSLLTSDRLLLNGSSHFYYNISLHGFTDILQAYSVNINFVSSCNIKEFIIFKFYIPWGEPSVHYLIKQSPDEFVLKLASNRPENSDGQPQLQVFIPSKCMLNVSLTPSFWGVIQQFTVYYMFFILQFCVLQILINLQRDHLQLVVDDSTYKILSTPLFVLSWLLIPVVILWKLFLRGIGVNNRDWWEDDIDLLYDTRSWHPAGYITSFFISFVLLPLLMDIFKLFVYLVTKSSAFIGGKLFPSPERRELARKVVVIVLHCFPLVEFILALSTCGAFSLLVVAIFYMIKACFINKNLESFVQYNSSLFMLGVFHFVPNSATFYLWASGLVNFSVFTDPSLVHGVISSICHFAISCAYYRPSEKRDQFLVFTVLMQLILFFYITHATVSMYMSCYFIDVVLILFAIHALMAVFMEHFPLRKMSVSDVEST